MVIRFRTIRQRRHRSRRGQVSAVATVLGLLIVVTFIANFVLLQLPSEEAQLEYQHVLQVENQMARLQATIQHQAIAPMLPLTLTSPVSLGSQADPPFGPAASSVISQLPYALGTTSLVKSISLAFHPPAWGTHSGCFGSSGGSCAGNGVFFANYQGPNRTTMSLSVAGTGLWFYNITANNDTIYVSWNGANPGPDVVVINGSYDNVVLNKSGSATSNPSVQFYFYGDHDTFAAMEGGGGVGGTTTVLVQFSAQLAGFCPGGNLSATDHLVGAISNGNSQLNINVTWLNSVGYTSLPDTDLFSGGSITWSNQTGIIGCAFFKSSVSSYTSQFLSGLLVHLSNHYSPAADVAYEQGAVILSEQSGSPIMVETPNMAFAIGSQGPTAFLMLVNFVGNTTSEAGLTTAGVQTTVQSTEGYSLRTGVNGSTIVESPLVNITTLYPFAWFAYFHSFPSSIFSPTSVQCIETTAFTGSCLAPPPGVAVTLSIQLNVAQFTIRSVTLGVSLI